MSKPCIICYEHSCDSIFEQEQSFTNSRGDLLKRFFKLLGRHLDTDIGPPRKSNGSEDGTSRTLPGPLERLIDAGISACDNCSKLVDSFCEVYHQIKSLELVLLWKMGMLTSIMSSAQEDPERVNGFRDCVNKLDVEIDDGPSSSDPVTDFDMILNFNTNLVKSCQQKLQNTYPKVQLRTRVVVQKKAESQVAPGGTSSVTSVPTLTRNDPEFFRLLRLIHIHGWPIEAGPPPRNYSSDDNSPPISPSHVEMETRTSDASENETVEGGPATGIGPIDIDIDMDSLANEADRHAGSDYLGESDSDQRDLSDKSSRQVAPGGSGVTSTPVLTRNDPEFFRLLRLIHIHGWPIEAGPPPGRKGSSSSSRGSDYLGESDSDQSVDLSDKLSRRSVNNEETPDEDEVSTGKVPRATRPRNHLCNVCGKRFSRVYHLNRHLKTVHVHKQTDDIEGVGRHPCKICGRLFSRLSHLKRHLETVHSHISDTNQNPSGNESSRMNDQDNSGADHPNRSDRGSPERSESEDKIEIVRLADVAAEDDPDDSYTLVTSSSNELPGPGVAKKPPPRGSLAQDPETLKFKCSLCPDKLFRDEYSFQDHWNSFHLGHRYKCSCGKEFRQKKSYQRHRDIVHKGIRFNCSRCGKLFTLKTGLQLHRRTTKCGRGEEGEESKSQDKFQCHICSKEFPRSQALQVHIKDVHEKVQDHLCPQCGRGFSRLFALQRHVKLVHEKSKTPEGSGSESD